MDGEERMTGTFPLSVLMGRELGFGLWSTKSALKYKQKLTKLTYREEDRMVVSPMNPIYSMEFCPITTQPKILAVSDEIGGVTLIDTQTNFKSKIVTRHECHTCSLYSVTWSIPSPNLLATGASDQTVCVWDANTFQKVRCYHGHSKTVRRVRFHPTEPDKIGSCSRDGSILLWDLRCSGVDPMNIIACAHRQKHPGISQGGRKKGHKNSPQISTPVTDFLFMDDNTLISCGATDSQIKFWDIRKTYQYLQKVEPVRQLDYDVANCTGYSSMTTDSHGNLYISTAKDDIIRFQVYSDSTQPDSIFKRPSSDYSINIGLSDDGRYLISGSVTPFACIWDTWDQGTQLPFVQLEGTRNGVFSTPCALFSPNDPLKVVTGSDDSSLTIWRLNINGNNSTTGIYESGTSEDIPLAPFQDINLPEMRFIPKHQRRSLTFTLVDQSYFNDLPNFVMDGQLPHVASTTGRRVSKSHTWLANFSLPKPSKVPIKKTIKLKRKVVPASSSSSELGTQSDSAVVTPVTKLPPKSRSSTGPPKKRQRLRGGTPSSKSSREKRKSLKKAMAECNMENDRLESQCPSILKYFSPVASPQTLQSGPPLRDIHLSEFDTSETTI